MVFRKARLLEKDTDRLENKIIELGLVFKEALDVFFEQGNDGFRTYVDRSDALESEIDRIRKDIEHNLYAGMLIPESRGDLLGLLEALDDVADAVAEVILKFDIENPVLPAKLMPELRKMSVFTTDCIEEVIKAFRSYISSEGQTSVFINKVKFFENEIDSLETSLKREIFEDSGRDLAQKLQLQAFVEKTADISDYAEHVCERLAISVIKRSI